MKACGFCLDYLSGHRKNGRRYSTKSCLVIISGTASGRPPRGDRRIRVTGRHADPSFSRASVVSRETFQAHRGLGKAIAGPFAFTAKPRVAETGPVRVPARPVGKRPGDVGAIRPDPGAGRRAVRADAHVRRPVGLPPGSAPGRHHPSGGAAHVGIHASKAVQAAHPHWRNSACTSTSCRPTAQS
jgi:hypothetical protein